VRGISYHVSKTGNLAGTLTLEFTNDPSETRWDTYTITIPAIAGGTNPQGFGLEIPDFQFLKSRLVLVVTGGTGAITARLRSTFV